MLPLIVGGGPVGMTLALELARLERKLLLVRPDHHVARRGNEAPRAWRAVLDR